MYSSSVIRQPLAALSFLLIPCLLILAGCSTAPSQPSSQGGGSAYPSLPPAGSGRGGYYMDDGPGDVIPDGLDKVPDAVPRVEPYSRSGNKPYVVFGKRYVPITDDRPFSQEGYGSWYGKKFQGQKTSSGELYDMYKMSAAHPTLPIPSYARVTNLANGRQVIVRVNDRGPFHSSRIIDLSYTAALKLGYVGKGSAKLRVERLLPSDIEQINAAREGNGPRANESQSAVVTAADGLQAPAQPTSQPAIVRSDLAAPTAPPAPSPAAASTSISTSADAPLQNGPAVPAAGFYLQFGAYSQIANAQAARTTLSQSLGATLPPVSVEPSNSLYKLVSGPFASREEAMAAGLRAQQAGAGKPVVVQR
jgi:rare lipoprotein A